MPLPKGIFDNDHDDERNDTEELRESANTAEAWRLVRTTVPFGFGRVRRLTTERIERLRAMPYWEYLRSAEWAEKRRLCLEDADHRCERCNARGRLEVHHTTYRNLPMEERGDLRVLCEQCHRECHPEKQVREQTVDPFKIVVTPPVSHIRELAAERISRGGGE